MFLILCCISCRLETFLVVVLDTFCLIMSSLLYWFDAKCFSYFSSFFWLNVTLFDHWPAMCFYIIVLYATPKATASLRHFWFWVYFRKYCECIFVEVNTDNVFKLLYLGVNQILNNWIVFQLLILFKLWASNFHCKMLFLTIINYNNLCF